MQDFLRCFHIRDQFTAALKPNYFNIVGSDHWLISGATCANCDPMYKYGNIEMHWLHCRRIKGETKYYFFFNFHMSIHFDNMGILRYPVVRCPEVSFLPSWHCDAC